MQKSIEQKKIIQSGNELIIQGAREAGFHLFTGYPGSPLADFFNVLYELKSELKEEGIRVVIANSEANAAAMASGAKQAHKNVILGMKSMGLHVAADALSVGNFALSGTGGVVVVVGDDPWSISTSAPMDSRYLFKHLHMPFLDPSTPQELKDWIKKALDLSLESTVYVGVLLTTFMAEGGGVVDALEFKKLDKDLVHLDPATFDLSKNVMVPPNSLFADIRMINERFPKVISGLKKLNLDQTFGNINSKIGFISSGSVFEMLKHVLDKENLLDEYSLYKIAAPYPLVEENLKNYLTKLNTLIVVEEKRGFLESELSELILKLGLKIQVLGKKFFDDEEGFPAHSGLNFDIIFEKVSKLVLKINQRKLSIPPKILSVKRLLPKRLPTFCPGCPHRETLSLLKDLRSYLKEKNINLISHGDVGCYSLSFLEPFKEMHNLSAMGQGGAMGAGLDIFTSNPSVVLMGDSTFFHSGITDISNSVQMDHDITYILLDNDNTAMTGHQMTPRTGISVEGYKRPPQDMLNMVKSIGVKTAIEVNPSDRYFYQNLLREVILEKGVKVIISNKECGLTYHGKLKAIERKIFNSNQTIDKKVFYQINTDACEHCLECVTSTGCPGLSKTNDAYGAKINIDPQICVADSYCTKLKACPSFEMVEVLDYHPTKYKTIDNHQVSNLVEPKFQITKSMIENGQDFRIYVTGVGGSGVTTISKVISHCFEFSDFYPAIDFKFVDQKGLAQRNGNVSSHLSFYKKGKSHSPQIPLAGADLILSPDLLDGATHLKYLKDSGHLITDVNFQVPLSIILDKEETSIALTAKTLANDLRDLIGDRAHLYPIKDVCFEYLGKSVYASAMILGMAYQKGFLPFSESVVEEAFKKSVPSAEFSNNWKAFLIGREYINSRKIDHHLNLEVENKAIELKLIKESVQSSHFKNYLPLFEKYFEELKKLFPKMNANFLARYIHDLIVFDGGIFLDRFFSESKTLKDLYLNNDELLEVALRTLAKTYFIKDEVYISHIMISPIRAHQDNLLYANLGSSFQKKFINRPKFDIGPYCLEFDLSPKVFMLKLMRHARFIRKLLPKWHDKERKIANLIRLSLLKTSLSYENLKSLENVKGYREVRYKNFGQGL